MAVEPELVRFDLDELVVRCPKCQHERRYNLKTERPSRTPDCPGCGWPWTWIGGTHV
ncbi:MAG: hypothetical protein ACREKK_06620 [Candidatus Methylomirabilales bacterium]